MDHAADSAALHELADVYRIDTHYTDWQGQPQTVADTTLHAVLAALDVDASTPQRCADALSEHQHRRATRVLPPCIVQRCGQPTNVALGATMRASRVTVEMESGGVVDGVVEGVATGGEGRDNGVDVPADLPTGYHRLLVVVDGVQHETPLIVTPGRVSWPAGLDAPGWGLAVQLYSAPSRDSWGVGDLTDLAALADWSARQHGADFMLINPVHAAEVVAPMNPSPYLPTSRRFGNPLYLRVEAVDEYADLSAADRERVERLGADLREQQRSAQLIDRDAAWAAKREALEIVYAAGRSPDRQRGFARYGEDEGTDLTRFATWCMLTERHGGDWHDWPAELQDPAGPAVAEAAADARERVDFYRWLQWMLTDQLERAQGSAVGAGMRLGVVHDLAVGVSPRGADSWSYQDVLATAVSVGAPPDPYSQLGQDWQQPPWRPDRLAELAYAPLRELFRNALRAGGGLRVDHIIGLFRLWWIPAGQPAAAGTYVHYDHEALIGILVLEAERAGAVIIGEDLGNVEPQVHDYLHERGILGTSILWFESDHGTGAPLPAQRWRQDCLASVTTHDLPPTTGYLAGDHIRLRDQLGLLTRSVEQEAAADREAQQAWVTELGRAGLLPGSGDGPDPHEIVVALHRFVATTPARLRCVAITDVVGERRTQNQPGTMDEYPNWRIPLAGPDGTPILVDEIVAADLGADVIDAARG